ncbi:septal ring lytic transglycosylase RlpA family protein [Salinisphaera sp. T31B1]|uniref:septal ring lytic transglycosylase RlpA family protein n=1 Tax=Salinisphaera sp. T31B1 TaxID=727963 RepID=UPI003341F5B0
MRRVYAIAAVSLLVGLLAGCAGTPSGGGGGSARTGGGYYQNDGPPDDENIDISAIPDAVPRDEPMSRYGNPSSYEALGKTYYVMPSAAGFTQTGMASWYGRQFHGRRTSSGEPYNMFKMTAAHKRLPIPSYVRVTNLDTGKHVIVRVNDRGPFHDGRIIDLSYVAARRLGVVAAGSVPVRIETVTPASLRAERSRRNVEAVRGGRTPAPSNTAASDATAGGAQPAARPVPVANRGNAAVPGGGLFLQSGAFGSVTNARSMQSRLAGAGFEHVRIVSPDSTTPLYRVRVGPFESARARALTRQRLVERGFAARDVER